MSVWGDSLGMPTLSRSDNTPRLFSRPPVERLPYAKRNWESLEKGKRTISLASEEKWDRAVCQRRIGILRGDSGQSVIRRPNLGPVQTGSRGRGRPALQGLPEGSRRRKYGRFRIPIQGERGGEPLHFPDKDSAIPSCSVMSFLSLAVSSKITDNCFP